MSGSGQPRFLEHQSVGTDRSRDIAADTMRATRLRGPNLAPLAPRGGPKPHPFCPAFGQQRSAEGQKQLMIAQDKTSNQLAQLSGARFV